jgi:hypothetical protein
MTTTTKLRGLEALIAYLNLRCESMGHWRLATIVDKDGTIVYELGWKSKGDKGRGTFGFGMFSHGESWVQTHTELLEVWKNMF